MAAAAASPLPGHAQDILTPRPLPHVSLHPNASPGSATSQPPAADPQTPSSPPPAYYPPAPHSSTQPTPASTAIHLVPYTQPGHQPPPPPVTAAITPAPAPQPEPPPATASAPPDIPHAPTKPALEPLVPTPRNRHTELATIEPQPVLDFDGKPLMDPDGNPVMTPRRFQLRDTHGRPVFQNGKPVFQTDNNLGFDEHGHRIRPPRLHPVNQEHLLLTDGVFYLDSFVARMPMNTDLSKKKLYFYIPGVGVALVSTTPFPGATVQTDALDGDTISVHAAGHTLRLVSDKRIIKSRAPLFVRLDRSYKLKVLNPVFGYGITDKPPYEWPDGTKGIQMASSPTADQLTSSAQ